jgi:hypothetical protein
MKYKRMADLDLHARKALQYTIIRPGGLIDDLTNGKCELGTPQLGRVVRAFPFIPAIADFGNAAARDGR